MFSRSSLYLLLFSLFLENHQFEGKPSGKKVKSIESKSNSSVSDFLDEAEASLEDWFNQLDNPLLNDKQLAQIGVKLLKQMRYEEAFQYFDKAIKKNQSKGMYYRFRGNCYAEKGELNKAISDYQTAISLDPDDEKTHLLLTLAFFEAGKPEDAAKQISALDDYELLTLGDQLADQNKFPEAITCYSHAIEKNPEPAPVFYNRRGFCHQEMGNLKLAIRDYEEAVRISPEFWPSAIQLSEVLFETGEVEKASTVLENTVAHFGLISRRQVELREKIRKWEESAVEKAKSVSVAPLPVVRNR